MTQQILRKHNKTSHGTHTPWHPLPFSPTKSICELPIAITESYHKSMANGCVIHIRCMLIFHNADCVYISRRSQQTEMKISAKSLLAKLLYDQPLWHHSLSLSLCHFLIHNSTTSILFAALHRTLNLHVLPVCSFHRNRMHIVYERGEMHPIHSFHAAYERGRTRAENNFAHEEEVFVKEKQRKPSVWLHKNQKFFFQDTNQLRWPTLRQQTASTNERTTDT